MTPLPPDVIRHARTLLAIGFTRHPWDSSIVQRPPGDQHAAGPHLVGQSVWCAMHLLQAEVAC